MKKTIITLTASLFAMLSPAQNLISSGSPLYKLPYKNTYVMQTLVAENTFRTAKVEKPKPGSFEQAKKVLPAPYWEGHENEIEMYWKAWQIGIKNVCQPLDNSGFVTSYISPAYNGNIFMWDDAFITMFCRYGDRFFPFQKTLDNFYAKQHPDGFMLRIFSSVDCSSIPTDSSAERFAPTDLTASDATTPRPRDRTSCRGPNGSTSRSSATTTVSTRCSLCWQHTISG